MSWKLQQALRALDKLADDLVATFVIRTGGIAWEGEATWMTLSGEERLEVEGETAAEVVFLLHEGLAERGII